MRVIVLVGLQISLLFAVVVQSGFAQTRPRKVEKERVDPRKKSHDPLLPANDSSEDEQQESEVLRIETTLVTVPVSVRDRGGKFIADLQQEDFHIYEDGMEQKVAYFATVEQPFTVVLMLDTSTSTWSKLGRIRDAAKVFVEQLRLEDQVMVTSFGMGLKVQCEATADRQKIRKAIDNTGRGLSTHLYDAMQKVMLKYFDRIQGRKAIVLFTDGVDATSNDATYESSLRTAEEVDGLIYSIRYDTYDPSIDKGGPSVSQPPFRLPGILRKIPLPLPTIGGASGGGAGSTRADYERGERYLQQLAELTGGQVYEANKDLSYLQNAFSQIAAELSRQYSLGYYPSNKGRVGETRRIKVQVNRSDVVLRARTSYVVRDKSAKAGKISKSKTVDKKTPVLKKQPFASGLPNSH